MVLNELDLVFLKLFYFIILSDKQYTYCLKYRCHTSKNYFVKTDNLDKSKFHERTMMTTTNCVRKLATYYYISQVRMIRIKSHRNATQPKSLNTLYQK